jgi:xylulose-5-phosphate/fructose-6-phosphate phosphoketolase
MSSTASVTEKLADCADGDLRLDLRSWDAHQLVHGRSNPGRFHVRGFSEEGTTTPFDMVVLNRVSRYHLAIEALPRTLRRPPRWHELTAYCTEMLARHSAYIRENLEDMPEVRDWTWRG